MLIRRADPDDVERICDIALEAFLYSPYGEKTNMANDKDAQQKRRDSAQRFCYQRLDWIYVAIEDDKIVGFSSLEYKPQEQVARVQNNAVLAEYRGRGISTALVSKILEELRSLGAKHITVHTNLVPAARRVYEKVGFKLVSRKDEDCYYEMWL